MDYKRDLPPVKRQQTIPYLWYALILIIQINISACGTLISIVDKGSKDNPRGQVYGGVKMNVKELENKEILPILKIVNIIDLPLSATLDTVLLPFTLWYNAEED